MKNALNIKIVYYLKVKDYLSSKLDINSMDIGLDEFDKILRSYLKHNLKLSVLNFNSEIYLEETMREFNIPERDFIIVDRKKASEILAYNTRNTKLQKIT